MSERMNFIPSGRDFIGVVSERMMTFFSCCISQIKLLSRIVSEDLLKLHQFSLVWDIYLGDTLHYVKPQVWIDKIWSEYLQYLFSGRDFSRFDQVRPMVSHLEVRLPKKPPTPNNIGEGLKVPQRNSGKKFYLCNMTRLKISAFFWLTSQSNTSIKEQNYFIHSLLLVVKKVTIIMHG